LDEGLYQIKRFVFGEGIKAYKSALENSGKPEAQTSLLIGRGYKSLGDYEEALRQLERAHQINKEDSEILGEMADCYDMIGNTRIAKLFFREAFYINPQGIALEFIESKIVKKIIEKLEEKELNQDLLKEWIPVYGVLYGVFNVKRELRPLEIGGLKQSIYALKNELQETKAEMSILLPRLINRYFWLIDHYLMIKEDRSRIEEVLLNIRVLDSGIYEMYTR
jgi:tetratricopeptide (TPR) repeat protein